MIKAMKQKLSPKYVIDVKKPFHVGWWAATLGVTEQDVIRAVHVVGVRAIKVRYYLRQESLTRVRHRHRSPCSAKRGGKSRELTVQPQDVAGEGHSRGIR